MYICNYFTFLGLVCHVEDIALLTESHKELKESIQKKTAPLVEGSLHNIAWFSSEWLADLSHAGFPSFSGISKLEQLVDWFGELTLQDAEFLHGADLHLLNCKLLTAENRCVSFILRFFQSSRQTSSTSRKFLF